MNSAINPTRLYTILIKTGLQTKDPVLYQLLYNLIGNVVNLVQNAAASGGSGGGGGGSSSVINNITNIIQSFGSSEVQRRYMMIGSTSSSTPAAPTYDSPLTNGDPLIPELIFDSDGDVVMVTGIPL